MNGRKILVLGASGFIGREIVAALSSAGWQPVAAGRDPRRLPAGVEQRSCDATRPADVVRAAKQTHHAVNAVGGRGSAMIAATANLCAAYAGSRSSRIIHLSSISVYGEATGVVGEDTDLSAADAYGAAKITCETIIGDFVAAGRDAVILRPGIVHGPGSWSWTARIAALLRARRLGDLGECGEGFCNLITAGDVGRAVEASLRATDASGEAINLGSTDPPSWNAYFADVAQAIGIAPLPQRVPRRLWLETRCMAPPLQAARLFAHALRLPSSSLPPPIPPSLAKLWRQRIRLDHRKSDALLGFARTPYEEGIEQAARWLLARDERGFPQHSRRRDLAMAHAVRPPR